MILYAKIYYGLLNKNAIQYPPAPWGHQAAKSVFPIIGCPISLQSDVLSADVNVQMSDVAMVDSRTEDWRSFRVCPGIQNLIFPSPKHRL